MVLKYSLGSRKKESIEELGIFPSFFFDQNLEFNELPPLIKAVETEAERDRLYQQAEELAMLYVHNYKENFEKAGNEIYSLRFHAFILKSYYFPFLLFLLSKYLCLKKFFDIHAKEKIEINSYSLDSFEGFKSKNEFIFNLYSNADFQEWISSVIVQKIAPTNVILTLTKNAVPISEVDTENKSYASFKDRLFCKSNIIKPHRILFLVFEYLVHILGYRFMTYNNIYGVGHFRSILYSLMLKLGYLLHGKGKSPNNNLEYNSKAKAYFDDKFIEIFDLLVERTHPYSFEKFKKLVNNARAESSYGKGKIRFDKTAVYDEKKAFKHALSIENGEKLAFVQHGSHYETYVHSLSADSYEYLGDFFIKWGKALPQKGKFCKSFYMPSPKISRVIDKHRFSSDRIIFVSSSWKSLLDGIAWVDPVWMFSYLKEKVNLIKSLNSTYLGNFLFRPWLHWHYETFNEVDFIKKVIPTLKLLEGSLSKEILSCKLLILDHYGTTLYEAMVSNVPTMFYFGYPEKTFTEEAQHVFRSLRDAGILHDNSTSVATAVINIGHEIESWWRDQERQSARQKFLEAFACPDANWNLKWMKLLLGPELQRG